MYRKPFAALIMTGCLFSGFGCSMFGSNSTNSGNCCPQTSSSCGLFSRLCGSGSSSSAASMPVSSGAYMGGPSIGYGGVDCPCSNQRGGAGMFHPAILSQGSGIPSGAVVGETVTPQGFPGQGYPIQQFQGQPGQVITPGVPPSIPGQNPPRIQPVPMAPGVAPSAGVAPSVPWGPQH